MAHAVDLLKSVEQLTEDRPVLEAGDTVNIKVRIVEGNRERLQPFQGVQHKLLMVITMTIRRCNFSVSIY